MNNTNDKTASQGILGRILGFLHRKMSVNPLINIVVLTVLVTVYIEIWNQKGFSDLMAFLEHRTQWFGINALIVLVTLMPGLVLKRRIFYYTLVSLLWVIGGTVNGVILTQRITPFTINDFDVVQTGLGVLPNYFTGAELAAMGGGLLAATFLLVIVFFKAPKTGQRKIVRGAVIMALCLAMMFSGIQNMMENGNLSNVFHSLGDAYKKFGFSYCFASTWLNRGVEMPPDYDEDRMNGILASLKEAQSGEGVSSEDIPNVVYVQLESFMDPQYIQWLECSEDPVANWNKLKESGSSGFLTVPVVGAGTSNTEMEILTGMKIQFFGPGEYPFETILKKTTVESTAYILKDLGLATHALHNHRGVFYGRNEIYANLGFDDFTSLEYMLDVTKTPKNWARDQVLTDEIMTALTSTAGRDYVYTVSVQGHGKYPEEVIYEDPAIQVTATEGAVTTEGAITQGRVNQFEYYIQQIHEMDQFIGDLTDALEEYDEPVVAVFYGDHLPNLGIEVEELTNGDLFQTEYVIWANYDIEQEDKDIAAYQLSAEVFDRLGIHDGTVFQLHQTQKEQNGYLSDLKALQYDMLYGEQYIYGDEGAPLPTDMKMGIRDIVVTGVYEEDGQWYVEGENFTTYSEVTVDGELLATEYISKNLLLVNGVTFLPDASQIQISQVEKYREVLSVSPETLPEL
ncbi:MAG: sulfatase-like hydrolase/transferase [Firmicutes bacterium]|nr:sulfatase-like hydrolase/transferase [Bacillota bacterium]